LVLEEKNNIHQSINLDENQDVTEMQIEPVTDEITQGINTSDDLLQHTGSPIQNVQGTVQIGDHR
jgi:hypothetical protein